jgi:NADH:ubiquinone oxidoreductase subunit C
MNYLEVTNYKQEYLNFINVLTTRVFNIHKNAESFSAKVARPNLYQFLIFLKYDFIHQIKSLLEITAYDNPGKIFRFSLVYSLISAEFNTRYQVYTQTDQFLGVETITPIYSAAN